MRIIAHISLADLDVNEGKANAMAHTPYTQLIDIKRWADRGLYEAVGRNSDRLSKEDASSCSVSSTIFTRSTGSFGITFRDCRTLSPRRAPKRCRSCRCWRTVREKSMTGTQLMCAA